MVKSAEIKEKIESAHKLMLGETTTVEKFESLRKIVHGVNPRIDTQLLTVSKALSAYTKLHEGDVIELTASHLPAKTDKEKKRKKALLLFVQTWKDLKSEVERVRQELQQHTGQSGTDQIVLWAKIVKFAKGPFGLITLAALVLVCLTIVTQNNFAKESSTGKKETIEVITFNGKKVALNQLHIGHGPDCGGGNIPHYHARDSMQVKATDGSVIPDPGACGYGKVAEVRVEVVDLQR